MNKTCERSRDTVLNSTCSILGWVIFRKSSPIKVCILWGNLDIYRVHLNQKKSAPYFIKFPAPGLFIHCTESTTLPFGTNFKLRISINFIISLHTVLWKVLFICEFHNKKSFWRHSEVVGFWPYLLAFKATGPEILLSKVLDFFGLEVFYICIDNSP